MRCTVTNLVLATMVAVTMSAEKVWAQAQPDLSQGIESPFLTTNRILQSSLDRIFRGSAVWREAVEAVRKTGRYAAARYPSRPDHRRR